MSSSRGGRYRRESTRPVDYNAAIIGENLVASTQDQEFVEETNLHGMHVNTKRDYRNRLNRLIEYWKEKEPGYFDIGVRDLNQEELNDTSKFYHKNKQDLVYTGLNVQFVLLFLGHTKYKSSENREKEKIHSHVNLRKFDDAIKWGAEQAGEHLPVQGN